MNKTAEYMRHNPPLTKPNDLASMAEKPREMFQDDGQRKYTCSPTACGYDGDEHCQNCGFSRAENEAYAALIR